MTRFGNNCFYKFSCKVTWAAFFSVFPFTIGQYVFCSFQPVGSFKAFFFFTPLLRNTHTQLGIFWICFLALFGSLDGACFTTGLWVFLSVLATSVIFVNSLFFFTTRTYFIVDQFGGPSVFFYLSPPNALACGKAASFLNLLVAGFESLRGLQI